MKRFGNKLRGVCAIAVAAVMTAVSAFCPIYAEEDVSGKERAAFVKEVVEYLGLYSRYDEVSQSYLYKEGLLGLLESNPDLYEPIMKSILESIDEHSEYYNVDDTKILKENLTGTIVGIGITYQMCADGVDVRSVIPGTPAAGAGICVGDILVSADDVSMAGMNSDSAASHIRGEEGTTVKIGIKRKDEPNIIYVNIVRSKIVGTSVTWEPYENNGEKLMYIKVYGFISNTAEVFRNALDEAKAAGIENLIIDVRDNGGGFFDQAILMADYLVPYGSMITTEDHKMKFLNFEYRAQTEDIHKFNTVVLINENSASASEVLAAALRENDCAYLIGTKSYGKGTIQTVTDLKNGDSIKYTIGYYLTPKGNNIDKIGLTPDAVVENTVENFDMSRFTKFGYTQVYRLGDRGSEIKTAKEMLKLWGSYDGEINEEFDEAAERAVYSFQSSTGLYPYGVLDLTTQHQLYTRIEKSKVIKDEQIKAAFAHFGMKFELGE